MASKSKPATTAAQKDDATKATPAKPAKPAKQAPAKPASDAPPKPAAQVEARPLFTGQDGKTLSGTMAVFAVRGRYDEAEAAEVASTGASGVLVGLPRLVELVGLFPTSSHTGAAKLAREAGLLGADQDAVTLNARFASAVDVPAAEPVVPPTAAPETPEPPRAA